MRCPEGGAGGWSPADLALPEPGGGLAFLVACLPFALALFLPPSPQPPSPPGKGETKGYFMQGASPLASPGLNPGGTGFSCGKRVPAELRLLRGGVRGGVAVPGGGRRGVVARRPCLAGTRRERLPFWSPACPFTLAYFLAPIPPTPFPTGRGRFKVYFAGGYRPRHPCNRVGCGTGFSCGKRVPLVITAVQGIQSLAGLDAALVSNGGSQGEGGPGERNFGV